MFIKRYLYDRQGNFKIPILKSPLFWGVLALKVIASFLFASHYLTDFFAKFANYFVASGFHDPYDFFFHLGAWNIFPYPSVMLWVLAIPRSIFGFLFSQDYNAVSNLALFVYRIPLLLADISIFVVLVRWLKTKQSSVLKYYWCSPILFYISYVHGQLDAVPIALLFVFLYFLFKEKFYMAFVFLGLAISAKTGMLIVLPFAISYLFLKKTEWKHILLLLALPIAIFGLSNISYLFSPGFEQIVLRTPQAFKIFDFQFRLGNNFVIYLLPFAYLLLLAKSLTFRTYNKDIFLMFLGFSFGILTLFIPPMQGWYFWVIPFLIYFYIKQDDAPVVSLLALNIFYFLYFMLIPGSDIFEVFAPVSGAIASYPNLYTVILNSGQNPDFFLNSVFSILQAVLFVNIFWIYRKGIESNLRYKISYEPYLIGLSGDSGSGKTTVASLLESVFGGKNTALVAGDDMHKWERGHEMWSRFTHLDPRANELHADMENAFALKNGESVRRRRYDHKRGIFALPRKLEAKRVVVFEGLHSLFLTKMRDILNLKVFLKPDEEIRLHWKVMRDTKDRGYGKEKVLEHIEARSKDSEKYIQAQEKYSDIIISLKSRGRLGERLWQEDVP
ncbi:MAG: hypothetical protein Q7S36_02335, partial [Candidatus Liptonbacteria bacterium]|nr:hypothetical protein [Candidatus Liptonbacteria bacterium]